MAAAKKPDMALFEDAQVRLSDVREVARLMAGEIEGWIDDCPYEKKVQVVSLTVMLSQAVENAVRLMEDFQEQLDDYLRPTSPVEFQEGGIAQSVRRDDHVAAVADRRGV